MSKLLIIATLVKDWQVEDIKSLAKDYTVKLEADLTAEDYPNIAIMYGWNQQIAENFETHGYDSLKWIQVQFAGINQVPEKIVNDPNIELTNMSGVHATPIVETVFGYILNNYRHLHTYKFLEASSTWQPEKHHSSLPDKKLLVFGAGNVGREIARIGHAFGMTTIGVNTSGNPVVHFDQTVKTEVGLTEINDADIIVNVLPATDATNELFNLDFFKGQSKKPLFINVGRGQAVIDEDLIKALDSGYLSYAALDVFTEEPLPENHPFWQHDKIDVTPHMTGQVEHFATETYKIFQANLESFTQGNGFAINHVSKGKGY